MNKYSGEKYYKTSNFYIAAFLFARGLAIVNVDKSDERRALFVFADTAEREPLLNNFNYAGEDTPEVLVDARKFITAIRQLKERLYQDNDQ